MVKPCRLRSRWSADLLHDPRRRPSGRLVEHEERDSRAQDAPDGGICCYADGKIGAWLFSRSDDSEPAQKSCQRQDA